MMKTLSEIEVQTKSYAEASGQLADLVEAMEAEVNLVKKSYIEKIRELAEKTSIEKAILKEAIESNPGLFVKPRKYSFHNVTVGFQKKKGKLIIIDEENTVKLIEKKFPDNSDEVLKTEKTIIKAALMRWDGQSLAKVGAELQRDTEEVFINSDRDKIEKFINALINENTDKLTAPPEIEQEAA